MLHTAHEEDEQRPSCPGSPRLQSCFVPCHRWVWLPLVITWPLEESFPVKCPLDPTFALQQWIIERLHPGWMKWYSPIFFILRIDIARDHDLVDMSYPRAWFIGMSPGSVELIDDCTNWAGGSKLCFEIYRVHNHRDGKGPPVAGVHPSRPSGCTWNYQSWDPAIEDMLCVWDIHLKRQLEC